jgi:hypothetical protein
MNALVTLASRHYSSDSAFTAGLLLALGLFGTLAGLSMRAIF